MAGDTLSDLDFTARIHVFGNARRSEAVTTNSFQDPACHRAFLNQLQPGLRGGRQSGHQSR
jgi:hypothetical protein